MAKFKIVVLISGSGSNLQAIIDKLPQNTEIVAVISNKEDAFGLQRAMKAGIQTIVIESKNIAREEFDAKLIKIITNLNVDLIVLAGFMRILTKSFTDAFHNQIINIHPSLLPKFKGLHTHQRAIEAGESEAGASVHFVNSKLDGGQVIANTKVKIEATDKADTLAAKVLQQEHILYPFVISLFANKLIEMKNDKLAFAENIVVPNFVNLNRG